MRGGEYLAEARRCSNGVRNLGSELQSGDPAGSKAMADERRMKMAALRQSPYTPVAQGGGGDTEPSDHD